MATKNSVVSSNMFGDVFRLIGTHLTLKQMKNGLTMAEYDLIVTAHSIGLT